MVDSAKEPLIEKKSDEIKCNLLYDIFGALADVIAEIFQDAARFVGTEIGLFLTTSIIIVGLVLFIVLTNQYNLALEPSFVLAGSVFGSLLGVNLVGGQVYKHYGFFAAGVEQAGSSSEEEERRYNL